ncbi:hypothetical protein ABFS83_04G007000 [Erythranthe nasuta]
MEKQRSFSIKPIRFFLVTSVTISFFVIFLIFFFSTWVIKTSPSLYGGPHNLTVQTFNPTSSSSSEYVLKNSILAGRRHFGGDNSSPQIFTADAEITGNSTSSRFSTDKSRSVDDESEDTDVITSASSGGGGEEFQELKNVIVKGGNNNNNTVVGNVKKVDCDMSKGKWIIDESYPLYNNFSCPFIDEGFNCVGNGRLNNDYMKWRWLPQDCEIPRFNATKMLELIRGKRLVFVGDSINRNQWESMLCLLMGGVKDPKKVYEARGRKITKERGTYSFKFEDYRCTVEYYVSHFLVHESKARIGKKRTQSLRIDTIDKGSSRWRGADILVFNTAHWWNHHKTKAGINYYQEGDQVHPKLDVTEAFRRSLSTWASWIDKNINPRKTRIFFRSSAPSHFSGGLWNTGGHCKEAFRPINETFTSTDYPEKNLVIEETISKMRNPVTFLNITRLSDYRPDAHPSIYGRKTINPGVQDCSHWCLPGVPDNWNQLLYYYLQSRTKSNFVD